MAEEKKSIGVSMSAWIAGHLGVANFLGFLVIVGLGYVLLFSREIRQITQSNRLQLLDQEKDAKLGYMGQLEALEKNYAKISEDDRRRVAAMIPREEDLPGIMASLEAVSQNIGITIGAMTFSPAEAGGPGGLRTVKVTLQLANANYDRFTKFLTALEGHLRLFDVKSANMNPEAAQYLLTLRAYVQPRKP